MTGLALFLVLAGTGVGHASWTAQSNATASVSAAALSVSQSGSDQLAFNYADASSAVTTPITVTNTSNLTATYRLALTATSRPSALAEQTTVRTWLIAARSTCATMPDRAASATWSVVDLLSGTLTPGESATYCVRTLPSATSMNPSGEITATVAVTSSVGTWSAQGLSTTITQTTSDWTAPVFTTEPMIASVSDTSVVVNRGAANDNFGLAGYTLSGPGSPVDVPAGYSITGLKPGTEYTYAVTARDYAGNSTSGAALTVTTRPVADGTRYTVAAKGDGKRCISSGWQQGDGVTITNCDSDQKRQWLFAVVGGGYTIASAETDAGVLTIGNRDKDTLGLSTKQISGGMTWALVGSGDTYQLRNADSKKCLVDSGSGNKRAVTQEDCDVRHTDQLFTLKKAS
ncbi:fibronectin type III domain-containing protein [Cryobacterium sp. MLB-32]|uniref:fibronectin type III domain-containing protein n=1 Tax=Cryobacterium sp. MLB-32 TaxID=1529318 RepID=UPI0018CE3B91|nr:fibronectin type III domain-containing protein [Cryobacterium sp. MLB-32]